MWDFSRPVLSGGRNLADGYHANISCLPLPRLTVRHGRPHCSCVSLLLLWLGLCSSVLSHLISWSTLVWPSLLCSDKTLSFALLSAIFIPSRVCQRVLTVRSFLSFPLQKQVMLQRGKCSTSVWRSASCHKGNNRGHKAAPKAPVLQSISDQQSI